MSRLEQWLDSIFEPIHTKSYMEQKWFYEECVIKISTILVGNILKPSQNGRCFTDDIVNFFLFNEHYCILMKNHMYFWCIYAFLAHCCTHKYHVIWVLISKMRSYEEWINNYTPVNTVRCNYLYIMSCPTRVLIYCANEWNIHQGPLLLTWINCNPSMDK